MKRISLLFVLLVFSLPISATPFTVPQLRDYVNDYANIISSSVKADLVAKLKSFEESDSTQLVILTVPSLDGETIEDYSIKVAESWKIGQKHKDNGILFTVSKQERKMRIEVGRGLEGKLTDLMAGRIIDLVITPKFKEGNYDEGFRAGVTALINATRGEFKAEGRPSSGRVSYAVRTVWPFYGLIIFFLFFILVVVIAITKKGSRSSSHGGGWSSGGGGWSSGGGSSSSSDSGGGSLSGGGGGFGGGGASGGW